MIKTLIIHGKNQEITSWFPLNRPPHIAILTDIPDLADPMGDPMMKEVINQLDIDESKLLVLVDTDNGWTFLYEMELEGYE